MKKRNLIVVVIIIVLLITNIITAMFMLKYKNNVNTMDSNRPKGEFNREKPTGNPQERFKGGKSGTTTNNNKTNDSTTTE